MLHHARKQLAAYISAAMNIGASTQPLSMLTPSALLPAAAVPTAAIAPLALGAKLAALGLGSTWY